eukprot:CAMPEP_0177765392 /NCGR_PEP_ID=MMETSP0491_2-20121128/7971_1 /TAXON_ID=63592 /ORGANISM="Tetraselmis chuii, Strain PLY429" /LENGTH=285 /DNA_ID=CAMNT_0019281745 /DNA_START=285 /DNA_END=1142 /DNA_ORIENTATION=-
MSSTGATVHYRSDFLADLNEGAGAHSVSEVPKNLSSFSEPSTPANSSPLLLIVLNYNLPTITPLLWEKADYVVVADGGANRLYSEVSGMAEGLSREEARGRFIPNAIVGDLDSISSDVRSFYKAKGVAIKDCSDDQDTTDLTKCVNACLQFLTSHGIEKEKGTILALGAMGGRLDHTLGNLNVLHMFEGLHLVLCGEGNLTRLIPAGDSVILPDVKMEGPTCGLIPLAGPVTASSTGLQWNLDDTPMGFGSLISTSNLLAAERVMVRSSGALLWTTEFRGMSPQV